MAARERTETAAAPARARPRAAGPGYVVSLRGTKTWRRWVHRLAAHLRTTAPGLIDRALVEIAARNDFPEKPPRRV